MRLPAILLAAIGFVTILTASAPAVLAGPSDTGALASCEIEIPRGFVIDGTAAVSIDLSTNLAVASFQTKAHDRPHPFVVFRVLVGPEFGQSPMEYICETLTLQPVGGGPTLAEQILAEVRLTGRTIKITKRHTFGCDVLPCGTPGRRLDLGFVPGSDAGGAAGFLTGLGEVRLFAVAP